MDEILRYLGIKGGCAPEIEDSIKRMQALADTINPECKYAYFDAHEKNNGIQLIGTDIFLEGNLAKKHFNSCSGIIVIIATLTLKSELLLKRTFAKNAADALVLDAVYTAKIEEFLDETEIKLTKTYGEITSRISCGYGDLALSLQRPLFNVVDGGSLGIKLCDSFMMTPNKSVIAIVGVK